MAEIRNLFEASTESQTLSVFKSDEGMVVMISSLLGGKIFTLDHTQAQAFAKAVTKGATND